MNNIFTGKTGLINLFLPGSGPETDDAKAVLTSYGNDEAPPVGRATNIEVYVQTDLEEFHEIGRRQPSVLQPGNIHYRGRIGRAYLHGGMLSLLLGRGASSNVIAEPYVQPTFGLVIDLKDPAVPGNESKLVLDGVKFRNWSFTMPEDDFVMEGIEFSAMTLHVIDLEAPAGGGDPVEHKPFAP